MCILLHVACLVVQDPPIVPATTSPLMCTGWRLVLSSANDMVLQNRTENEPGLRNYTFVGLEPDTQYRARVAGINIRGTGNYSATITARTNRTNRAVPLPQECSGIHSNRPHMCK